MFRLIPVSKLLSFLLALLLLTPSSTIAQAVAIGSNGPQDHQQSTEQLPVVRDCGESRVMGETDAKTLHSGTGWMAGGFFSGVALGLIGAGIITACAAATDPEPKSIPNGVDAHCYSVGYADKGGSINTWKAFGGGLVGTLVIVTVLVVASGSE